MVPREAGRGSSFKGAGLYYLHDKAAMTSERVAFTHTENLPTHDPQKALGWMAWTAMIAPDLKRAAGVAATGRQGTKKPVYTVSLAWHPEQRPTRQEMIAEGRAWLAKQGLQSHQVLMVAHSDREHSHIHLIVNLVNPLDGRVHRLPYSKLKSSRYAQAFEQAAGKVYCPERVENNRRRDGKKAAPTNAKDALKATVAALYAGSDSGRALQAGLQAAGLLLAQGKKIVVIDAAGEVHSLARLIDGVKEKVIAAKLASLPLPSIKAAQSAAQSKTAAAADPAETYDRDQEDQDWQEAVIDAGIARPEEKGRAAAQWKAPAVRPPATIADRNALESRHLEQQAALRTKTRRDRETLTASLDQTYGAYTKELRRDIASLTRRVGRIPKLWASLTGKAKANAERLAASRRSLENVEWRKAEAYATLAEKATVAEGDLLARQRAEGVKLEQAGGGGTARQRALAERAAEAREAEASRPRNPHWHRHR